MTDDDDISLNQAQKLESLGLLAGGIAHDFNNILSIIEGYAQIGLKHQQDGKPADAELKKILEVTQRGAGLTRQLLAFARQKIEPPEKINLVTTVRGLDVLLKPLLGADIQLVFQMEVENLWIVASADFITQILLNLTVNARDAMPGGGVIHISCRAAGSEAVLKVQDGGCGMSPAVVPRIFDPFFTTKPRGRGTGLGLSVVHGIVAQLGGRVALQSQPGAGTVFEIFLPRIAAPPAAKSAPDAPDLSLQGRTVLIAEDEPELRDMLGIIFSGMEMKVLTASNGNEAMSLQRGYHGTIDFLFTDIVMPGMNGVTLGELFEAARPESNVIYMSGYPFPAAESQLPPDADFMSKPLRESKIRDILRRALERRDQRLRDARNKPPEDHDKDD